MAVIFCCPDYFFKHTYIISKIWNKATDVETAQSSLLYDVIQYNSGMNPTTLIAWTPDINLAGVTDLTQSTQYYFLVRVKDEDENITESLYQETERRQFPGFRKMVWMMCSVSATT